MRKDSRNGDCLIFGGAIYTMDPKRPQVEAVAIKNGRIVYVGDKAGASAFKTSASETIDLKGRIALPGFVECHSHVAWAGQWMGPNWVNCGRFRSVDEIIAALRAKAADTPPGEWVLGFNYNETLLKEKRHPNRWDLNSVSEHHKVFLMHFTMHFLAVNSAALQWVGVNSSTQDPPGGWIDRDDRGEPTGVFRESAVYQMRDNLPAYSVEALSSYLVEASNLYLSAGVTSVVEAGLGMMGLMKEVVAIARLAETRRLPLRYGAAIRYPFWKELQAGPGLDLKWGNPEWMRPVAVKLFQDGALHYNAALSKPSCGQTEPGEHYLRFSQEEFDRMVLDAHTCGWQVWTHANGELAIESVLDAYERAMKKDKRPDPRHRIEHCQFPTDEQLDRMAALHILPSFFPAHIWHWGDQHLANFGVLRAARLSPMASALKRGLTVGMHNDAPFTPMEPLVQVGAAVTRRARSGDMLGSEEGISVDQALQAITLGNAYLAHEEGIKGVLVQGKLGDVVVLEADPFQVRPIEIKDIPVAMTIVGGRVVCEKK
jgi:predicted amidohydrolase YtcJ